MTRRDSRRMTPEEWEAEMDAMERSDRMATPNYVGCPHCGKGVDIEVQTSQAVALLLGVVLERLPRGALWETLNEVATQASEIAMLRAQQQDHWLRMVLNLPESSPPKRRKRKARKARAQGEGTLAK